LPTHATFYNPVSSRLFSHQHFYYGFSEIFSSKKHATIVMFSSSQNFPISKKSVECQSKTVSNREFGRDKNTGLDTSLRHVNTSKRLMALTFDDGPKPGVTEKLLLILRRYHIKATFFIVGKQAEKYPDLILQIVKEGHELANHSYTHSCLTAMTSSDVVSEIQKTNKIIQRYTGSVPIFFRPPGGNYNQNILNIVNELGMKTVFWTVNAQDYFHPNSIRQLSPEMPNSKLGETLEDSVGTYVQPGTIVLLHNGDAGTLQALPPLLFRIKEMGLKAVTLKELLSHEIPSTLP
jgi:peptidoglycan/xylan/chitin deacetylase (PgdA/CDA1 family)